MNYTQWYKWGNRKNLPNKNEYGTYYIAHTPFDIEGQEFEWNNCIVYIGESNSQKGVDGRLDQFEKAMNGKDNLHGGAERVRYQHNDADLFFSNAYVALCTFAPNINDAEDWRQKGKVRAHEYYSIAYYLEMYGELPQFNNPKSKKK